MLVAKLFGVKEEEPILVVKVEEPIAAAVEPVKVEDKAVEETKTVVPSPWGKTLEVEDMAALENKAIELGLELMKGKGPESFKMRTGGYGILAAKRQMVAVGNAPEKLLMVQESNPIAKPEQAGCAWAKLGDYIVGVVLPTGKLVKPGTREYNILQGWM
jgi:hypothetical protein